VLSLPQPARTRVWLSTNHLQRLQRLDLFPHGRFGCVPSLGCALFGCHSYYKNFICYQR